jgi:hypothetical protein
MAAAARGRSPIHPGGQWVPGSLVRPGTRRSAACREGATAADNRLEH